MPSARSVMTGPSRGKRRIDHAALQHEAEANAFAEELLMPAAMLLQEKGPFTEERIHDLANEYGVTDIRMAFRLSEVFAKRPAIDLTAHTCKPSGA